MKVQNEPAMLEKIAETMTTFSDDHVGSCGFGAGMTYIGQMISHDIVPPTRKNDHCRTVTPYLNLDSIYGQSPSYIIKFAPEQSFFLDKKGRFIMSKNNGVTDLQRRETATGYEAIIPEPRNDTNRIVSQLHLFWQSVHNWLLDHGYAEDALEAKKYTTLLFQLVAIEEFCASVLAKAVFEQFFSKPQLQLKEHFKTIPAFFSNGSFRFGHSIVRSTYKLNSASPTQPVGALFGKKVRLTKQFEIDWNLFFARNDLANKAVKIDTSAILSMRNVPDIGGQDKVKISADAILLNLRAGASVEPSSGYVFIGDLRRDPKLSQILIDCEVTELTHLEGATFKDVGNGLDYKTLPLLPYILLEAEQQQASVRLGSFGSFLNARVLYSAISHSEFSVISNTGYDFERAVEMLDENLSLKLKNTIKLVANNHKPTRQPIMEALILLIKG